MGDALSITTDDARMLFHLLDVDKSGKVDLDEFTQGCLRLQGDARAIDVHMLIFQVKHFLTKWAEFTQHVDAKLQGRGSRASSTRFSVGPLGISQVVAPCSV